MLPLKFNSCLVVGVLVLLQILTFPIFAKDVPIEAGTIFRYHQYSAQEVVKELEEIKLEGYNQLKIGIRRGQYESHKNTLLKVLDWCNENGVSVWFLYQHDFPKGPASFDRWLVGKNSGERRIFTGDLIVTSHPAISGVLLGNEVNVELLLEKISKWNAYEAIVEDFKLYLKRKYLTIDNLNRIWRVNTLSFDDLDIPVHGDTGFIDAERYLREKFAFFYSSAIGSIKGKFSREVLFGSKVSGTNVDPFLHRSVYEYDVASWDHRMARAPAHFVQLMVDALYIPLGRPVYDSEVHMYHDKHYYGSSTESIRFALQQDVLLGQRYSSDYNWGQSNNVDNQEKHKIAVESTALLLRNEDIYKSFFQYRKRASVAYLVTEGNRGFDSHFEKRNDLGVGVSLAYSYMSTSVRRWKYILEIDINNQNLLHGVEYLVFSGPWLSSNTLKNLLNLDEAITIIVIGGIPKTDEYGGLNNQAALTKLKERSVQINGWGLISSVLPLHLVSNFEGQYVKELNFEMNPRGIGLVKKKIDYPALEIYESSYSGKSYIALANNLDNKVQVNLKFTGKSSATNINSGDIFYRNESSFEIPLERESLSVFLLKD